MYGLVVPRHSTLNTVWTFLSPSSCWQFTIYRRNLCSLVDICLLYFLKELLKHLLCLIIHLSFLCVEERIWEFGCHRNKIQISPCVLPQMKVPSSQYANPSVIYMYIKLFQDSIHWMFSGCCFSKALRGWPGGDVTHSVIFEREISYFLKIRMTEWVEWMQESLLHSHYFRMRMSCLLYPPGYVFLAAQLTDKLGCSERAPEKGK